MWLASRASLSALCITTIPSGCSCPAAGRRLVTVCTPTTTCCDCSRMLIVRAFGLSLEDIRRSLDDPRNDRKTVLLNQKDRLKERALETTAMIRAIDVALAALDGGRKKGVMKMEELFEGFNPSQYEEEARNRWGTSDAFTEAEKRTKGYSPADWKAIKAEQAALYGGAYAALKAGKSPSDASVMDIAERHRLSIDRWFYPCSHRMHSGLASMYESDDRFRQGIDAHGEGLAAFLAEAIRANASRHRD